jgi:cytochrome c-type biogenesis protein CcmH/NrfG
MTSSVRRGSTWSSSSRPWLLGRARSAGADFRGAVDALDEALRRHPDNAGGLLDRARARSRLGQRAGAIEDLERVLARTDKDSHDHASARQLLESLRRP